MTAVPRLSIVVPFFNEALNVDVFFDRLLPVLDSLQLDWEAVCIDDGSRDDTMTRLIDRHRLDGRIKVLGLSRNFGKERALSAGLAHATMPRWWRCGRRRNMRGSGSRAARPM